MASAQWLDDAFNDARRDFLSEIPTRYKSEFSRFGTIDHVYQEIDDIQLQQEKTRSLIALNRIHPYLIGLGDYFGAVETFVQVKPEVLCLIWGPLKLILQFARSLTKAFQKLVAVLEEIGHILPQFKKYADSGLLRNNDHVKTMMCLFYRDILDLHLEMFKFYQNKHPLMLLEALWPHFRGKLAIIQSNIEKHKMVMTSNVTLEHVIQAHEHRQFELKRYEVEKQSQNNIELKTLSLTMSSPDCTSTLRKAIQRSSNCTGDNTGEWLFNSSTFDMWLKGSDVNQRRVWIRGIPGAGKTILTANVIKRLVKEDNVVVFAFLSNDRQSFGSIIPVLHSLIYQALEAEHSLIEQVFDASKRRNFALDAEFVFELFCKIAHAFDPLFVAIDGLDEIEQPQREELLKTILELVDRCSDTRLLVSSREESDIMRILENKALCARLEENNGEEIKVYVQRRGEEWVADLRERGADDVACASIMDGLGNVVSRAKGMFLYAHLVLNLVKADRQADLDSILKGLADLPEGLDQAYGRILLRLRNNPIARRILLWIAHSKTLIRETEILQAILINVHMVDFTTQKKAWVDIRAACGPVIDIRDGLVRFVHFTAKEFLIGDFSQNFLDPYQGHTEALKVCLTYLSLKSFDVVFAPEYGEDNDLQVRRNIMSGDFVMFPYAARFWFEHLRDLSGVAPGNLEELDPTAQMVARFYNRRRSSAEVKDAWSSQGFLDDFRCFEDLSNVRTLLAGSSRFYSRLQYGNLETKGFLNLPHAELQPELTTFIEDEILEDPTAVSRAIDRFENALEAMISDCSAPKHPTDCQCQELHNLYGVNVFKCSWRSCRFSQSGFPNAISRDQHHEALHRTLKCPKSGCPFTKLGFPNERDLAAHVARLHDEEYRPAMRQHAEAPPEWDQFNTDDVFAMLEQAVINSDVSLAQGLVDTVTKRAANVDFNLLLQLAVWKGSDSVIQWVIYEARQHITDENDLSEILQHALYLASYFGNIDRTRALVSSGADPDGEGGFFHPEIRRRFLSPRGIFVPVLTRTKTEPIEAACRNVNPEMVNLFACEFGIEKPYYLLSSAISATQQDPRKIIDRLPQFKKYGLIHSDAYSYGVLSSVLYRNLGALEMCLDHGGDPNFPKRYHRCPRSPLYKAVELSTEGDWDEAMTMIERLLRAGARPQPQEEQGADGIEKISKMQRVEKHFGMSWKEIVRKVQAGQGVSDDRLSTRKGNT